jgi:dienelactone hydrolase
VSRCGPRSKPSAAPGSQSGSDATCGDPFREPSGRRFPWRPRPRARTVSALAIVLACAWPCAAAAAATESLTLRGCPQTLHLYGARGGPVAIVTSGDGGWVHLGPDVAEFLAARGYFVVGFDAKAYLAGFTSRSGPLRPDDVPQDYGALLDLAQRDARGATLLVGVSEGAGLSVLAATAFEIRTRIDGVVALGLPDKNELAWRFRDSIIYVTKKTPNEPTFSTRALASQLAPVPLAALHATHDEFVPVAEVQAVLAQARDPKRLWLIEAADHRFSDNRDGLWQSLKEAIAWIGSQQRTLP